MQVWMLLGLVGCGDTIRGNRDVVSETRRVRAFDDVSANNAVEVVVSIDPTVSGQVNLEVSAESNLIEFIDTEVAARALTVDITEDNLNPTAPMQVAATVERILTASANNAARLQIDGVMEIDFALSANNAATILVDGIADNLDVDLDNGASVDTTALSVANALVSMDNGASATICATDVVTGVVNNGASLTVRCGGDASGVDAQNGGTVQ